MVNCVVIECHKSGKDENWQSFPLPKTQGMRKRWLDLVNIDFKKSKCDLDKSVRVCSRHFKESDMNYKMDQRGRKTKRRVLKPLALPTENLFRRKHLTDFKPRFDFSIKFTYLCLILLQVPKYFGLLPIFCARPKIDLHIVSAQKKMKLH